MCSFKLAVLCVLLLLFQWNNFLLTKLLSIHHNKGVNFRGTIVAGPHVWSGVWAPPFEATKCKLLYSTHTANFLSQPSPLTVFQNVKIKLKKNCQSTVNRKNYNRSISPINAKATLGSKFCRYTLIIWFILKSNFGMLGPCMMESRFVKRGRKREEKNIDNEVIYII